MHAIIKYVLKEYVTYDRNKSGTASLAPLFYAHVPQGKFGINIAGFKTNQLVIKEMAELSNEYRMEGVYRVYSVGDYLKYCMSIF
jgi:hypothetical protein